jgi:polyhydroxyalkanoate synthase
MAKQTGTKKAADKEAAPATVPPETEAEPADSYRLGDAEAFGRNMARVAAKSQHLLSEFLKRQTERFGQEPIDPLNVSAAFFALLKQIAANPGQMLNAQIALWQDYLTLLRRTTQRAFGGTVLPMVAPAAGDRRFRDKDWPDLRFHQAVLSLDGELDAKNRRRCEWDG